MSVTTTRRRAAMVTAVRRLVGPPTSERPAWFCTWWALRQVIGQGPTGPPGWTPRRWRPPDEGRHGCGQTDSAEMGRT